MVGRELSEPDAAFEMGMVWGPVTELLSHLSLEEFILIFITVLSLWYGTIAALKVITGATKPGGEDADLEDGTVAAVATAVHDDVEKSTRCAVQDTPPPPYMPHRALLCAPRSRRATPSLCAAR